MKIFVAIGMCFFVLNASGIQKGEYIYKHRKCYSCHGMSGNNKAFKVSRYIKDLSKDEIETALLNYQQGKSQGQKYSQLMKGQLEGLSKEDIHNLALYIDSFKK